MILRSFRTSRIRFRCPDGFRRIIRRKKTKPSAIYLKAFDEIRRLYSEQQLSQQLGYAPGFFSFNSPGGRCEECKGEGT